MDDGAGEIPDAAGRQAGPRLRGAAGGGVARRVRRARREPGRVDVLHERHHRQPQGRRLLAPLDVPAHLRRADLGRPRPHRGATGCCRSCPMFHANAWGLAHAAVACGADLVMPGPDLSPEGPGRRSSSPSGSPLAAGVPTIWMGVLPELEGRDTSQPAGHPVRRVGRAAGAVRGVPRAGRPADHAGVGHDRDVAGGVERPHQVDARRRARRRGQGRPAHDGGPAAVRRRGPHRAAGRRPRSSRGTASRRASCRSAGPWIASAYYNDERSPESFTDDGWLKTGDVATIDADGYIQLRRPHEGRDQVGRRVDQLGRARERDHGPPRRRRGRRHRPAPPQVERAPAGLRGARARASRPPRTRSSPSSTAGSPSGGCPTTWCSSTRSRRRASASSRRRTCAPSSPTTRCRPRGSRARAHPSAAVAQGGGQAVDRELDAALGQLVVVARRATGAAARPAGGSARPRTGTGGAGCGSSPGCRRAGSAARSRPAPSPPSARARRRWRRARGRAGRGRCTRSA